MQCLLSFVYANIKSHMKHISNVQTCKRRNNVSDTHTNLRARTQAHSSTSEVIYKSPLQISEGIESPLHQLQVWGLPVLVAIAVQARCAAGGCSHNVLFVSVWHLFCVSQRHPWHRPLPHSHNATQLCAMAASHLCRPSAEQQEREGGKGEGGRGGGERKRGGRSDRENKSALESSIDQVLIEICQLDLLTVNIISVDIYGLNYHFKRLCCHDNSHKL